MVINGFDWDEGNRLKCQKHGLTRADVEGIFLGEPVVSLNVKHFSAEERYHAVGQTQSGRYGYVVFTFRRSGSLILIRPISARYMHQKEIEHYERQRKG